MALVRYENVIAFAHEGPKMLTICHDGKLHCMVTMMQDTDY